MTKKEIIWIWVTILLVVISAYLMINRRIKKAFTEGFETGCWWTFVKVDSINFTRVNKHGTYIEYPSMYAREQFLRDKYLK